MNSFEEWCEVLSAYQHALGATSLTRLHCHLSGIEYGVKGERKHLMIADSDFNLNGLLHALAEFGCGGRILCESPQNMDVDALKIKKTWQAITGDGEEI